MTSADKRLEEKLKPFFSYEVEFCGNCRHSWYSHYWNGAGNPENAGWASCIESDCRCTWDDAHQETVTEYYEETIKSLAALIKEECRRARIEELEKVCCCDVEPINEENSINVCYGKHVERIEELSKEVEK